MNFLEHAIREAADLDRRTAEIQAITGETRVRCASFVTALPRDLIYSARRELARGMTLDQFEKIAGDTLLAACWRLGFAGREFVREIVGVPTAGKLLANELSGVNVTR